MKEIKCKLARHVMLPLSGSFVKVMDSQTKFAFALKYFLDQFLFAVCAVTIFVQSYFAWFKICFNSYSLNKATVL